MNVIDELFAICRAIAGIPPQELHPRLVAHLRRLSDRVRVARRRQSTEPRTEPSEPWARR